MSRYWRPDSVVIHLSSSSACVARPRPAPPAQTRPDPSTGKKMLLVAADGRTTLSVWAEHTLAAARAPAMRGAF
eukprot:CAMPEP_0206420332 /NCGR_PEP_ID=MMETSP0324_2-20121206/768_1 /ASSEMBLY_ACC=CAM_ASM_000836 /TAXON_ID=2866 /ORGANISM="Crypthecodinium cohnii, Strain Seligo" /LENGTH=73 /DNA_ID=CAMNT_0053884173 /DNA_START=396 /DNA_END=617 /DNA_ORIENTATION=+